jgi:polyhydroxybutyrate depolymerase
MTRALRLCVRLAACAALAAASVCTSACFSVDPAPKPSAAQLLQERPYDLHLPAGKQGPLPLLLALHGQCGSPLALDAWLSLTSAASAAGVVLALPYGEVSDSGCAFWNASGNGRWPYDEDYLAAVIADVAAKQQIDPKQVWVLGNSLGAFMAQRFGCARADVVTGVVSLAGLVSTAPGKCEPTRPLAYLGVHGDADSVISYDGSPFIGDPPRQSSPSAHDSANLWATHDGCAGPVAATGQTLDLVPDLPGAETLVERAPGCPAGSASELWTIHGADHGPEVSADFSAQVLAWLAAHAAR